MKRPLLALSLLFTLSSVQAQLLKNLKDKAAGAVQSATGVSVGSGSRGGATATDGTGGGLLQKKQAAAITFSATPFTETSPAGTTDSFAPTGNIYARVELPGTLQDLITQQEIEPDENDHKLYVPVSIRILDGQGHGYESLQMRVEPADLTKRVILLDVLPAPGKATTPYMLTADKARPLSAGFSSVGGNYIPFGKHAFAVIFGRPNDDAPAGAFEMTIPDKATAAALAARTDADAKILEKSKARSTKLPPIFSGPGTKFADPALSPAGLKKLLGPQVLRYVVASGDSDYRIVRNDLGVVLRKESRNIWAVCKDSSGDCFYTRFVIVRQHVGGGQYGAPERVQSTRDNVDIACENVK